MNNKGTIVLVITSALALTVLFLVVIGTWAEPPQHALAAPLTPLDVVSNTLSYQGHLLDADGNPVDAITTMTFSLYDQATSGTALWTQSGDVSVNEGLFTVYLNVSPALFDGQGRWLGVHVAGDAQEMTPRQPLLPVPYAFYALAAPWSGLSGVPEGFADGVDDVSAVVSGTNIFAGEGLSQVANGNSVTMSVIFAGSGGEYGALSSVSRSDHSHPGEDITSGTVADAYIAETIARDSEIIPTVWGNAGAGSGLDADLLDGEDGSYYLDWGNLFDVPPGLDDGDDDTTYTAGIGLALAGSDFEITMTYRLPQGCGEGQLAKWNASGWWECQDDQEGGGDFWSLTGNAGTTPGANFLGTTDPASLMLGVNDMPALRLEPGAVPNIVGGDGANYVISGASGAVIGGGGNGAEPNRVTDDYGTVGGGVNNQAGNDDGDLGNGAYATVGGGGHNTALGMFSTIAGGDGNFAEGNHAAIGGGMTNQALGPVAAIGGGEFNFAGGPWSVIAGGSGISVTADYASAGGGQDNVITATHGTIGGGGENTVGGDYATVGGGYWNRATGSWAATVGGGLGNVASGSWAATIAGGEDNVASGQSSAVGGGVTNYATGDFATVSGGGGNAASYAYATVGGGWSNVASDQNAMVGGGWGNVASGQEATVGGGYVNVAGGDESTVGGGEYINVTGYAATVSGGSYITATGDYAAVGGGWRNVVTATNATVGGGRVNTASSYAATVGGGDANTASGNYAATVAGGNGNTASGDVAVVGGGQQNDATGAAATIAGGRCNNVAGIFGTIGGGGVSGDPFCASGNNVTDNGGTISGGGDNQAGDGDTDTGDATYATVGGGYTNVASGSYATVPGGQNNTAQGDYSFAAGYRAQANHLGSFVWSDSRSVNDFTSQHNYQFRARAYGGFLFEDGETLWVEMSYLPSTPISTSTGAYLSGGGVWTNSSDRNLKENFEPVDGQDVLARLAELPVTTWNYKADDPDVRHMGPVAQDFYAIFGLGEDDRHIAALDSSGVALAAAQALATENADLRQQVDDLEARLAALEAATGASSDSRPDLFGGWLPVGVLVVAAVIGRRRFLGGE